MGSFDRRRLVTAVALLLLAGCADKQVRVERIPFAATGRTWTGRSEAEVVRAWGEPSSRRPDAQGGTLLTYLGDRPPVTFEWGDPRDTAVAGARISTSPGDLPSPDRPPAKLPPRTLAAFWIDAEGRVYRCWFAPAVYEKGSHVPPPDAAGEGDGDSTDVP